MGYAAVQLPGRLASDFFPGVAFAAIEPQPVL